MVTKFYQTALDYVHFFDIEFAKLIIRYLLGLDDEDMENVIELIEDDKMTERFREAIKIALEKQRANGFPIQRYDLATRKVYLEHPDGRREYL